MKIYTPIKKDTEEDKMKEDFKHVISYFEINDNNEIVVWDRIIEKYSNSEIVKKKIKNLIILMNEKKKMSDVDFKLLLERDIETDIWNIV